jgi:hypothetical protein
MAKVVIVLLATLFVCGLIAIYVPLSHEAAFGNSHGISWLACLGCVSFFGFWKMLGK